MVQLPDGSIIGAFEIERDFIEGPPDNMFRTWEPLNSGAILWEAVHGLWIASYRCHFRSVTFDGVKYCPDYDSEPRLLEARTL